VRCSLLYIIIRCRGGCLVLLFDAALFIFQTRSRIFRGGCPARFLSRPSFLLSAKPKSKSLLLFAKIELEISGGECPARIFIFLGSLLSPRQNRTQILLLFAKIEVKFFGANAPTRILLSPSFSTIRQAKTATLIYLFAELEVEFFGVKALLDGF
jgi:hypothetical protein